jgi:nucleoside-diphosphate-sugar epimerase
MSRVLLTGATGFLGGVILARLIEETDHDVVVLVRAEDASDARRRLAEVSEQLWGVRVPPRRVLALAGDIERADFGLTRGRWEELAAGTRGIVHSAATIRFDLPLADARRTNVGGAANVAALAEAAAAAGRDPHVVHISTAYVAGDRQGVVLEDDPLPDGGFRNTYEQSKAQAESVLMASRVPTAIVRPSIIVGESGSGWTSAFNVIYGPLRAMASGRLGPIPADGGGLVDLVPVDVVAGAAVRALDRRATGAFHVASGEMAVTGRELSGMVASELGVPEIEFEPDAGDGLGSYTSYLNVACRYSTERTRTELGLEVPPVSEYLPQLLSYAREARWGKRVPPRRQAALAAA